MFGSEVTVDFQSVFFTWECIKIIFLILKKIISDISTPKQSKKSKMII
jgi:hypothetical protein